MDERSRDFIGLTPGQLRALYAAVVAGLVVFISVALFSPAPIHSYRTRAVVEQTAQVGEQVPLELQLLTQPKVDQQASDAFLTAAAELELTTTYADAIVCQVERPVPQRVRVTIEAQDRYADHSLDVCRAIAGELVRRAEKSFVPGLNTLLSQRANIEQRLALTREAKRAAEDELSSLTSEQVAELATALQMAAGKEAQLAPTAAESQRLRGEWQRLQAERSDLSRNKTDAHPQMKDIDQRLAETKARINALDSQSRAAGSASSPAQQRIASVQDEYRRRSRELSQVVSTARRREEVLLSEAAQLAATPAAIPLTTVLVQEPELVERIGGQPSRLQVAMMCLLAIAAGGLTYGQARRHSAMQRLNSAAEIEARLDLPVISLGPAHRLPTHLPWDSAAKRSLQAAEISLLVLAAATIVLLVSQPELAYPAVADPIGAIAESLDRTFSPLRR